MSLMGLRKISEEGVKFQSHIDGSYHFFTPEKVMEIQKNIGADIIMTFDECPPYPATREYIRKSMDMTINWAKRCRNSFIDNSDQTLFGIVQGGIYEDFREECFEKLADIGFAGYAIGGLAVGEEKTHMYRITKLMGEILPANKPRYLMGVGTPLDLITNVMNGVDMFDCVMPTRNARKGTLFTSKGKLIVKAARYKYDEAPIDEDCPCYTCQNFSRGYLRHLFNIDELLAMRLASLHSVRYYMDLMKSIRNAIVDGTLEQLYDEVYAVYGNIENKTRI